jgi:hypothetical protein
VYLDAGLDTSIPASLASQEERIEELKNQIDYLRDQLTEEREARRRADTIIAQLTQANATLAGSVPELEAPSEPPESPETDSEEADKAPPAGGRGASELVEEAVRSMTLEVWILFVAVLSLLAAVAAAWATVYYGRRSSRNQEEQLRLQRKTATMVPDLKVSDVRFLQPRSVWEVQDTMEEVEKAKQEAEEKHQRM